MKSFLFALTFFTAVACLPAGAGEGKTALPNGQIDREYVLTQTSVPLYSYRISRTFPHDIGSYTEGLVIDDGVLYEGTGRYGRSHLYRGDLAGGSGDNWDTHRDHFPKMKDRLLPVFDRAVSALLTDLEMRGMLDETLVVFLTDFGRTPKINGNGGRDHHPGVYSMVLAGGGIPGGQVYGSSDSRGISPGSNACTPADFHATVYKAMGIDHHAELHDQLDRPFQICDGEPLPIF